MENWLICANAKCRFLIDFRRAKRASRLEALAQCPECGSQWMKHCPHCLEALDFQSGKQRVHCTYCHRSPQPQPASKQSALPLRRLNVPQSEPVSRTGVATARGGR